VSAYNNSITIIGNLGRDPEIKEIAEIGHVVNFTIAVYRSGKGDDKRTDWFTVEAWHDLARGSFEHLHKGDRVMIFGSLKNDSYEKDGIKITKTKLLAREIGKDISVAKQEAEEEPF
jgi:single-strand DNA-binding protein